MTITTLTTRCQTCPTSSNVVLGNGPVPCRVMCVGEAPGQQEDRQGVPLVGPTGQEFNNTYLPLAGLTRADVYVTNAVLCRPALNRKPTDKERACCSAHHMPDELSRVQPEVVLLMGATACGVAGSLGIDLEVEHGIPRWCDDLGGWGVWSGWVVPMWYPALGLHETSAMTMLLEDWAGLRRWLETGEWTWATDPDPNDGSVESTRDYRLGQSPADVDRYFADYPTLEFVELLGTDTETHDGQPFSLQVSRRVGTGLLVLESNTTAIRRLAKRMDESLGNGGELVLHQASADLDIIRQHLSRFGRDQVRFRDTMQECYHQGNLPQGLKALSYRLLGRRRQSWAGVVTEPSKQVLGDWIMRGIEYAESEWTQTEAKVSAKTGKALKAKITPSKAEKVLRSVLGHTLSGDGYDTWAKVRERLDGDDLVRLIGVLGPVPTKGVRHISLGQLVEYGCSDSDDTLALAVELDRRRKGAGEAMGVRREDWDQ